MKKFIFPTNKIIDATSALIECEKYCGLVERCWGCSAHTNTSNQWNAIPKCGELEKWEGLTQGDVTQKPSTERKYKVSYFTLSVDNFIDSIEKKLFNNSYFINCSLY